jgi:hydroxylaminobenzene mutase
MDHDRRRLLWHGMALFLLGLLTGLVGSEFSNPRMGLSAHVGGVMNGVFLLALGAIWRDLQLGRGALRVAFAAALYGTYANWAFSVFAAVFGTGALTPIAAPGRSAAPWQELVVTLGLGSVGGAMLIAAGTILFGLRGRTPP